MTTLERLREFAICLVEELERQEKRVARLKRDAEMITNAELDRTFDGIESIRESRKKRAVGLYEMAQHSVAEQGPVVIPGAKYYTMTYRNFSDFATGCENFEDAKAEAEGVAKDHGMAIVIVRSVGRVKPVTPRPVEWEWWSDGS